MYVRASALRDSAGANPADARWLRIWGMPHPRLGLVQRGRGASARRRFAGSRAACAGVGAGCWPGGCLVCAIMSVAHIGLERARWC